MARLPADGTSVQTCSSGSIQSTPSLLAAPAAEKTTEQDDDGHDAGNLSAKPLAEPVPDVGNTAVAVLDAHEAAAGRTGGEEGREVESSTSLPPGEGVSPTPEAVERTDSQEACPAVHQELEIGAVALIDDATEEKADQSVDAAAILHEDAKLPDTQAVAASTPPCVDDIGDSSSAAETGGTTCTVAPARPSVLAETKLELVGEYSEAVVTLADPATETDVDAAVELGGGQALTGHGEESEGESTSPKSPPLKQDRNSDLETDGAQDSEANPEQEGVFIPSKSFTGAQLGYAFKTGDKGLGFYVDGYVDQPVRGKPMSSHRPWNAGPGEQAIRRRPLGPIPKPFKKIVPLRTRKEKKAAEESDT